MGENGCKRMEADSGIVIGDVCEDGMQNLGDAGVDSHESSYFSWWGGSDDGGSGVSGGVFEGKFWAGWR